jgi:hypothetical protein
MKKTRKTSKPLASRSQHIGPPTDRKHTFRSKARNPRTTVTTVGISKHDTRRSNGKSTRGKSFKGGEDKTIGKFKVGKGIKMIGPLGFGTGTERRRWEMHLSRGRSEDEPERICRCDRNRRKAVQKGYLPTKQIVLFSKVVISSNPVSRKFVSSS